MAKDLTHPLRKNPPEDALERISDMAANGWSKAGIARKLGVSVTTFDRWLEEDEDLQRAFDMGRDAEHNTLFNSLFKAATEKGNATAAMFLLKARHGYREGDQSDIANRVSITFALPGAEKLEAVVKQDKKKIIDHER